MGIDFSLDLAWTLLLDEGLGALRPLRHLTRAIIVRGNYQDESNVG